MDITPENSTIELVTIELGANRFENHVLLGAIHAAGYEAELLGAFHELSVESGFPDRLLVRSHERDAIVALIEENGFPIS